MIVPWPFFAILSRGDSFVPDSMPIYTSVRFAGEKYGWISGRGGVYYSDNGGQTWKHIDVQIESRPKIGRSQNLLNLGKILVCDKDSALIRTSDAIKRVDATRSRASTVAISNSIQNFEDVSFVDWSTGWAISRSEVFLTSDGGKTWNLKYNASFLLKSVAALAPNLAWVAGLADEIASTGDGGVTWKIDNFKNQNLPFFSKIFFLDSASGWLLGATGIVLRYDGPTSTWNNLNSSVTHGTSLYGIAFADSNIGWIVGDTSIFYSRDGGRTWIQQEKHIKDVLIDVWALPYGRAWAVGSQGTVLYTTNYGKNWLRFSPHVK